MHLIYLFDGGLGNSGVKDACAVAPDFWTMSEEVGTSVGGNLAFSQTLATNGHDVMFTVA